MTTGDPNGSEQRLAESAALPGFWDAAPAWEASVARREVQGRLVVWSEAGTLLALSPLASIVAGFFDGAATLDELAEDLAAAAEVDLDDSRTVVSSTAVELYDWGIVDGVVVAAQPDVQQATTPAEVGSYEEVRVDPTTGADIPVVVEVRADGSRLVTERLPDGRRRVTSELTFNTADGDRAADAAEALAAKVLSGERSAAELVPPGSCLGSKLRDGDDIPLLSVRCHDGRVRSVRCHDPAVAALLVERAGPEAVAASERGPVEAFVVTPLEGDGPLRIYDGRGRRRGRPRTALEAVDVVDQLLGESAARHAAEERSGVPLSMAVVHDGSVGVLIDPDALDQPGAGHRLRAAGWIPTYGVAEVHTDAAVAVPSMRGDGVRLPVARTTLWVDPVGVETAELATVLAGPWLARPAPEALDRLVDLAVRAGTPDAGLNGAAAEVRRLVTLE